MNRSLCPADVPRLLSLLAATEVFRPCELEVAEEVLERAATDGPGSGYHCFLAEDAGEVAGFACYGPTPCTEGTYDLYWIAVARARQGDGLGTWLLREVEEGAVRGGGRLLVAETSGSAAYAASRRFYEARGFSAAARVADFYQPGDDKIIYVKPLLTPDAGR